MPEQPGLLPPILPGRAQPPPGLISISLLADETVTGEITRPITPQLTRVHSRVAGFSFLQREVRVGFFLRLFRSCEIQPSDAGVTMKYGSFTGWLGDFRYLRMHIYAKPAPCFGSLGV